MFVNLYRDKQFSAGFIAHNHAVSDGVLHSAADPGEDVEMALRNGGVPPDCYLLSVLTFTLSESACRSFLEQHRGKPITERDYYLSKLYQVFLKSLLDEGNDFAYFDTVPGILEAALDEAFPVGSNLELFSKLDWFRILAAYAAVDLKSLIKRLPSYLREDRRTADSDIAAVHPTRFLASRNVGESVAEFIDRLRKGKHLTIEALAAEADLNESQIYRLKKGLGVKDKTLRKVADALKCSLDDLQNRVE